VSEQTIAALTDQMNELKVSVDDLAKERDFYFKKVGGRFINVILWLIDSNDS
jgi:hypothetical protein